MTRGTYRETYDVFILRPKLRERLVAFLNPALREAYMSVQDRMELVGEGIIEKRADGLYYLTPKAHDELREERENPSQHGWNQFSHKWDPNYG